MRADSKKKTKTPNRQTGTRRLLWFAGIYVASLVVFATTVYLLRWLILPG